MRPVRHRHAPRRIGCHTLDCGTIGLPAVSRLGSSRRSEGSTLSRQSLDRLTPAVIAFLSSALAVDPIAVVPDLTAGQQQVLRPQAILLLEEAK